MIYGIPMQAGSALTKIEFKGFEISIAMDDSYLGGMMFRINVRVFKDTTDEIKFVNTGEGVDGEGLFKLMQEIAKIDASLTSEELALAQSGQRVQAVKAYRARTGADLKKAVDTLRAAVPL